MSFKILSIILLISVFPKLVISAEQMDKSNCKMVFDAGSTGSRLYIFEKSQNNEWEIHEGPKTNIGISDPIRKMNGKTLDDIDSTAKGLSNLLNLIRFPDPKGKWMPFDWKEKCKVSYLGVLATAGMRMAEQESPGDSAILWQKIKTEMTDFFNKEVPNKIETRTISGIEEGLFAWLSLLKKRNGDYNFGLVEMGGTSSQLVFPCKNCPSGKNINLEKGKSVKLYIHSFLGLGENAALERFGITEECKPGAGLALDWTEEKCGDSINFKNGDTIIDYFNFDNQGNLGDKVLVPMDLLSEKIQWYLTGSYQYPDSVELCCKSDKQECFKPEMACFKNVYKNKFLKTFGIKSGEKSDASWTHGVVLCQENDCLKIAGDISCPWVKNGCL